MQFSEKTEISLTLVKEPMRNDRARSAYSSLALVKHHTPLIYRMKTTPFQDLENLTTCEWAGDLDRLPSAFADDKLKQ
jgi:hypothetical protein